MNSVDLSVTHLLNIIEVFASVQGETSFTGCPTTFIRLAACNLRCTWCDTAYSFGRGTPWTIKALVEKVEAYGLKYVCVTGGEPLLQEGCLLLLQHLCELGYVVSLETGGSLSTSKVDPKVNVILDIKCPGSGMAEKNYWPNLNILRKHDEVKFVVADRLDYCYAADVCKQYELSKRVNTVLLSPVFGLLDPRELVSWILEDKLPVRLNLQIHKFIWLPETKGV